ncbi:hypothetical protein D8B34_10980 [Verminephrobacter eiseniae]|nr:hypothetical protein [Verminephrobacter eiseniae]MCW8186395.1 hypothetical protein [Verminephrobacter eiseniae]MCW8224665.1 hypothetical protein [Verminephrobacter eiseniae]MCW8234275.1 hypothetical protein [Verminephrobacter eiseniae]
MLGLIRSADWGTFAFGCGVSAFGRPCGEGWSTFAFGYGVSAFGRPGGEGWSTFAFGYGVSAFGRPGGEGWSTFAFGYGVSAFGRPGGAHATPLLRQTGASIGASAAPCGGASTRRSNACPYLAMGLLQRRVSGSCGVTTIQTQRMPERGWHDCRRHMAVRHGPR